MGALIAVIVLGILVATLIEINERMKAKKSRDESREASEESREASEECKKEQPSNEDCSGCGLADACEKSRASTPK